MIHAHKLQTGFLSSETKKGQVIDKRSTKNQQQLQGNAQIIFQAEDFPEHGRAFVLCEKPAYHEKSFPTITFICCL